MGSKIYNTPTPKVDHCIGYVDDDGTIYSDNTRIVGHWIGFVDSATGKVYDSPTPKVDHCIGCVTPDGKLWRDSTPIVGHDIGFVRDDGTVYSDNTAIVGHWIGFVEPATLLGKGAACYFILKGILGSNRYVSQASARVDSSTQEQGSSYEQPSANTGTFQEEAPEPKSRRSFSMPSGGGGILGEALVVIGIAIVGYLVYSLFSDTRALVFTLLAFGLAAGICWYFKLGVFKNRKSFGSGSGTGGFANAAKSGFDKARSAGSAAASRAASAAKPATSHIPHPTSGATGAASGTKNTGKRSVRVVDARDTGGSSSTQSAPKPPADGGAEVEKTIFGDMVTSSGTGMDDMFQQFFGSKIGSGSASATEQDSAGFAKYGETDTSFFYRCATCGGRLRLPKGAGTVLATCPKCGRQETVDTGKKPEEPKPSAQQAESASVKFVCPVCSRSLTFPAHIGTISFKCPTCGTTHTFDTGESAL